MAKEISSAELAKKVAIYQKEKPGVDFYFTTDGQCFRKEQKAKAHAATEKLKVVAYEAEVKVIDSEDTDTSVLTEDAAKEKLLTIDLNKALKDDLVAIAEALSVTPETGDNKDDYIAALKTVKEQLQEAE